MSICMEHVSKAYDGKYVFSDLNLVLESGKSYALFAPSGSGKTTLLRLILGLEKAESGQISGVPGRIGVVFQEDRLLEDSNAIQNITLVMDKSFSKKEKKKRAEALLEGLGLSDQKTKKIASMSGGMKRRVSIARALAFEGELLILDEPFDGLDQATKEVVVKLIQREAKNATILLVTHDMDEVNRMQAEVLELAYA